MSQNGGNIFLGNARLNVVDDEDDPEDLEEQERRKEEIAKRLAVEMGNYNDQSTMDAFSDNSYDESQPKATPNKTTLLNSYCEASMNNQLQFLYEVRLREIDELKLQVQKLESELFEQEKIAGMKLLRLEAESQRTNMTLEQAQNLLAEKTEENTQLQSNLDARNSICRNLETTITDLKEERKALEHDSNNLHERLLLMERGLSTTNTISDKQLHEKQRTEIERLKNSLDNAMLRLERLEKENQIKDKEIQQVLQEKAEIIAEKAQVINMLTHNLENAQVQSQELLNMVEQLAQENKKLKEIYSHNQQLQKAVDSAKTDHIIIENLQKAMKTIEQKAESEKQMFKMQIQSLTDERERLAAKLENTEKELESNSMEDKYTNTSEPTQVNTRDDSIYKILVAEKENTKKQLKVSAETNQHLHKEISKLQDAFNAIQDESAKHIKSITRLETSVQVLTPLANKSEKLLAENQRLQGVVENLKVEMNGLQRELQMSKVSASTMEKSVQVLTQQPDQTEKLLEENQHLHGVISKMQEELDNIRKDVQDCPISINTTEKSVPVLVPHDTQKQEVDSELLKAKFEAELVTREIDLRQILQKEFDSRLQKRANQQLATTCHDCAKFKNNEQLISNLKLHVQKLQQKQLTDRQAIEKITEEWVTKFQQLVQDNQELAANKVTTELKMQKMISALDVTERKVLKMFQKEQEINKQYAQKQKQIEEQHTMLLEKVQKMCNYMNIADKKVQKVEKKYAQKK